MQDHIRYKHRFHGIDFDDLISLAESTDTIEDFIERNGLKEMQQLAEISMKLNNYNLYEFKYVTYRIDIVEEYGDNEVKLEIFFDGKLKSNWRALQSEECKRKVEVELFNKRNQLKVLKAKMLVLEEEIKESETK